MQIRMEHIVSETLAGQRRRKREQLVSVNLAMKRRRRKEDHGISEMV